MSFSGTLVKRLTKYIGYLFLSVPIVISGANWMLHRNYWFNTDPAAWYFLDSLAVFAGKSYVYVDHPGTPVHLLGSLMLGVLYPFFDNSDSFIRYHLAEPETFFIMTNFFLLAMNLFTMFVFYGVITSSLERDKVLAGIALSWMYFAIHPHSFNTLTYWSHNSFNFIFGTLWLLWLYKELQAKKHLEWSKLLLLGISVGALAMTQLYLLPWLAGGVATVVIFSIKMGETVWGAYRKGLIMFGSGVLGITMMLLPIYKELPRLIGWLVRLAGSTGLYGAGESGFYSLNLIPLAIIFWGRHAPLFMIALTLTFVFISLFFWMRQQNHEARISPADFALLVGLLVQTILLILILTKMFYRLRYLLSLAAILPILLLVVLKLLENTTWNFIWTKRLVYSSLIVSALFFMIKEVDAQNKNSLIEQEAALARSKVVARLANNQGASKDDITVVYAFGTPIKCAGLLLANNWVRAFDEQLSDQCPNQYALYDFAFETDLNLPHPVKTIEEIDWDLVIWPGNGSDLPLYLNSIGADTVPRSWKIKREKWFYIR